MSMKRGVLCIFSLILYLMISCLLLSQKIEVEMLTQVEAQTYTAMSTAGKTIKLPLHSIFFTFQTGDHLYEIVDGSGWEDGLRIHEVPREKWSLNSVDNSADIAGGSDYRFVMSASRHPRTGELVEVVSEVSKCNDQYLLIYDHPGVPKKIHFPAGAEIAGQTNDTLLLNMKNVRKPFFQHRAKGMSVTMDAAKRIFSLGDVRQFFEQLPTTALVFQLLAMGFVFCLRLSYPNAINGENKVIQWLNLGIIIILLYMARHLLRSIDLPSSLLPETNIFQVSYYTEELSAFFSSIANFPNAAQDIFEVRDRAYSEVKAVFGYSALLTVVVLLVESKICKKDIL